MTWRAALNSAPPNDLVVRALETPDEMSSCVGLYESIFALGPGDGSLNTRLLVGISRNSGIVVGAFGEGQLIGFSFSFLARDDLRGTLYQYSQIAAVDERWQGHGIGRRLKLAQRAIALSRGIDEIRWSFDPFQIKNAHFNLDVLGAKAHELVRDLYGDHGHGLDARSSSNRLIAVWALDSQQVCSLSDGETPSDVESDVDSTVASTTLTRVGNSAALVVPATFERSLSSDETTRRDESLLAMEQLFREGFEAVSCRRINTDVAQYRFVLHASEAA
jgi:predicted GNAT superfamily acetyltransferase